MDSTQMDAILDELAAGRIDREEAARRIGDLRSAGSGTSDSERIDPAEQPESASQSEPESTSPSALGWPTETSPVGEGDKAADPAAGGAGRHDDRDLEEDVVEPAAEPTGSATSEPEVNEEALGRPQTAGVSREDFRRPVHAAESAAGTSDPDSSEPSAPGGEQAGSDQATDGSATADSAAGDAGSKGASTGQSRSSQTGAAAADLGSLWSSARAGFDRIRSDAERGFDRLKKEAEARIGERTASPEGSESPSAKTNPEGVERIMIRSVGRRIRVIGDSSVSEVGVEGAHTVRRRDRVIEIISEGDVGPSLQGFSLFRPPRSFDDVKSMGLGKELVVRVNPALWLDAEVTGGSLRTEGVPQLGKVRVTVGGANFVDVTSAEDVLVQAGPATMTGTFVKGRSRVRCESGSLTVSLGASSNVTVHTESQLGRIVWAGNHAGGADEVELGNGSARLDVGVVMATATIRTSRQQAGDD